MTSQPKMPGLAVALMLALLLPVACSAPPAVGAFPAGPSGAPPPLLPIEDILASAEGAPRAEAAGEALAARAARLRARAGLMRGPVHDPATRERLAAAIRAGRA